MGLLCGHQQAVLPIAEGMSASPLRWGVDSASNLSLQEPKYRIEVKLNSQW